MQSGIPANSVYVHIVWPVMLEIEKLHRKDKITPVQEHLAARGNRTSVDQLQNKLPRRPRRNKRRRTHGRGNLHDHHAAKRSSNHQLQRS